MWRILQTKCWVHPTVLTFSMSLPQRATIPSGVPDIHKKWGLCYTFMKYRPGFGWTECRRQTLCILQAMHVTWQIWLWISPYFIHRSRTCMSCWEPQWWEEAFRLGLHSSTVPLVPSKVSSWQICSGIPSRESPTMRVGLQGMTQTRGRTWNGFRLTIRRELKRPGHWTTFVGVLFSSR